MKKAEEVAWKQVDEEAIKDRIERRKRAVEKLRLDLEE